MTAGGGTGDHIRLIFGTVVLMALFAMGVVHWQATNRLLLAPMIGALDNCIFAKDAARSTVACRGQAQSAVHLIESTLQHLGPTQSPNGSFELGYTLNVPLLRLFQRLDDGQWQIDRTAVQRIAQTIRDVERPVVLYLFSTHFGVGGDMESALAKSPANLAHTPKGPLPKDMYYNVEIFPWSVARIDNEITLRRSQAMKAVLDAVCELPSTARQRVRAVTVLGEVHQLFPRFETGMGFESEYQITDYSEASVLAFRAALAEKFGQIARLNEFLQSNYSEFSEVNPPSLDIRNDKLTRFHDHIDAYAGGAFPVSGWVSVKGATGRNNWVHIYVNGAWVARVPARFGRQDVFTAKPELGSADVGWRHDIDFSGFAPGIYQIDMALESGNRPLQILGRRTVGVIDRNQNTPPAMPQKDLPSMLPPGSDVHYFIDSPQDQSSVYFNPLVPLWHAFRAKQVTGYLKHMGLGVKNSCLAEKAHTHQILPFTNPGWDVTRFAIEDSLLSGHGLRLGISLYGEPIYGDSFIDWFNDSRLQTVGKLRKVLPSEYGVTEFHPLRAMSEKELSEALDRHRGRGAHFVSFFMEPRWNGELIEPGMNIFSLDPQNHRSGSDELYRAFSAMMRR